LIRCLFGVWRGERYIGLTPTAVLGKIVLVNRSEERIIYSPPTETVQGESHEIGADPGEAICFTRPDPDGTFVAVGSEDEVIAWVNYYFFTPHLVPDEMQLTVQNQRLTIATVPVISEVLKSYSAETVADLQNVLRKRYVKAGGGMVETLLHQLETGCKGQS